MSNGQRSHVWFTFSTTFANVIPKAEKGNEPRTYEEKNSSEIWPSRPVMLIETKSSYSTPNPSANIINIYSFGHFSPFSISLIYEADNPVSTPSCLRTNPFYYQKQRSFIPKKIRKLNLPELDVSSGLLRIFSQLFSFSTCTNSIFS